MNLDEAVAAGLHTQPQDTLHSVRATREEMVRRFPLAQWPTMSLEQYAMGTPASKQSFSYALEVGTRALGSISGGSAAKFGVFLHNTGEWRTPHGFVSVEDAWQAIRSSYCALLDLAQAGEWGEAAALSVPGVWPSVVLKALHIYFPDDVLPVFANARLTHYADLVGVDPQLPPLALNRAVSAALREHPALAESSGFELMRLLESWQPPPAPSGDRDGSSIYLKVAPGERASEWGDCLREGYICVGWDEVGDLALFESEAELVEAADRAYPEKRSADNKKTARKLWAFRNLKPGNHVVANRGTTEVLAIGTVLDAGYLHRPERAGYRHTVAVDWDTSVAAKLDPGFSAWRETFHVLKPEEVARIRQASRPQAASAVPALPQYTDSEHALYTEWTRALDRKKQLVFYGPPGTGKTYSARRFAHWYAERHPGGAHDAALTQVTFHASYTYEEFVEGYRPTAGDGGGLRLALTDGVFKKICAQAAHAPDKVFFLLVDELNRANVPRVFGELMTVIEADKRGMEVLLPASQEPFAVPPNLLVLATMNTADRSIRSLDAALRRRFAFAEILPDPSVLEAQTSGGAIPLALDMFLEELNRRITEHAGRERQIGHAFFLSGGEPITGVEDFAQVIRLEVIPLLQELAYDDYSQLARYLGPKLVDAAGQRLVALDDEALVELLADEYGAASLDI